MKMICMGLDISDNDISCSKDIVNNVDESLSEIVDDNVIFSKITNVTGDDITVTTIINDDSSRDATNKRVYDILHENALGFDDLDGVAKSRADAGEGISYAEIELNRDFYPDAVVVAFDTYCGESFVSDVALKATKAIEGMDNVGSVSCSVVDDVKKIPGVGYVSKDTDDPVIVASVENTGDVGVVAGAAIGAILGYQNTYLVRRNTPCNVIPGSAIFSVSAIMNCNIIDLSHAFIHRCRLLE